MFVVLVFDVNAARRLTRILLQDELYNLLAYVMTACPMNRREARLIDAGQGAVVASQQETQDRQRGIATASDHQGRQTSDPGRGNDSPWVQVDDPPDHVQRRRQSSGEVQQSHLIVLRIRVVRRPSSGFRVLGLKQRVLDCLPVDTLIGSHVITLLGPSPPQELVEGRRILMRTPRIVPCRPFETRHS
jgi:hypothetical protein